MVGLRSVCAVIVVSVCATLAVSCAGPAEAAAPPPVVEVPEPAAPPTPVRSILPGPPPQPRIATTPASPSFSSLPRPTDVVGNLNVPLKRDWTYIVIHDSATDEGNAAIFDRAHKRRGWKGVGYDFVIDNGHDGPDGRVEVTFRWKQQIAGAHAGNEYYNQHGIGICLVGNFDNYLPTAKQMDSLVALVNYLQARCDIPTSHIVGHYHVRIGGTHCPGGRFPWMELFSRLGH